MFSEYASKFLAQSQSRFSNFVQPDNADAPPRNPNDRYRQAHQPLRNQSRGYTSRLGNPYQSTSNFNFSRYSAAPADAPLFHSALDDFREEDDEEERERETADFFALQKSRRTFAPIARLDDSRETDPEASHESVETAKDGDDRATEDRGRGRGIKSSWNGGGRSTRGMGHTPGTIGEEGSDKDGDSLRRSSEASSRGRERMEDVGLESTIEDDDPPEDLAVELEDSAPAFQNFRSAPKSGAVRLPTDSKQTREQRDAEASRMAAAGISRPPSSVDTIPATIATTIAEAPSHDVFFGSLYLICLGGLFATFFLVFLHTETPDKNIGDTIYTTLHASFHLFAVDTVVSIVVSLVWIALLRSFVRSLVHMILLAVPVILFSFSLYPFVSSYKGAAHGNSLQDKAMRWLSFIPGIFALIWVYTIYKGRHSLNKAIGILEFASRILAANPALLGLGFATLGAVVVWTWMWLGMFTRVFLGGHLSTSVTRFIIDATSWWLAAYFVLMYIWSLSVISGIQRSTTGATVSQWYFHRNAVPAPASREVVIAALSHATTTIFGTICLSTLIALLIRLPLLLLPRRLIGVITIFAYSFIPTPIAALTNPLTLTYAAIHSQALHPSARGLSQMTFLSPQAPTTTLTPRSFTARNRQTTPLLPYRLAKLLLHATRFIMAMALGFGGWVVTARQLNIAMPEGAGIRGSAYAYVVGLVASFIGWGVLGAMEGVLSGIVDASVVCWGSERGMVGGGAYCLEAGYLFGEGRERDLP
ncbi:related to choline transporter-like protein [Rhynchosporium agropyri]|uniref:Protein PNS1 n=1 Tax=Rhynchosporium agropyri TaxID=914238 RepID=A0A1E1JUA2_9HELO|nr:related to choline transporter-like protein [Rhynchosporium agropyri]